MKKHQVKDGKLDEDEMGKDVENKLEKEEK
jgi:hypothetical protein